MSSSPRILLMAGGTGGHIFPALAVAQYLTEKGWKTHWLGSEKGMEVSLIPQHGIDLSLLSIGGIRGKGLVTRLLSPFKLLKAIWQSIQVINKFSPDVILGMGGFASGPGGLAAWLLRKPLCIHEQNAIPGVTNRVLSKLARFSLQAFPGAIVNADAVTGNPVRQSICDLDKPEKRFAEHQGSIRLLVIGGSRGAAIFNQLLPEALLILSDSATLKVRHQTGKNNRGVVLERYSERELINDQFSDQSSDQFTVSIEEFITDMDEAYQWADLVLCRAGALTVSELAAVGLGAIFVPYPYAVDDHQTANANYLVNAGAAEIIPQSELSAETLADTLAKFSNREQCQTIAIKARQQGKPEATREVADFCVRAAGISTGRQAA